MGKAQARVSRLLQIVAALEAGEGWHAADLAERFGVSRTQIYKDVRCLRAAGVPVQRTGQGYRIAPSFHLPSLRLTSREVLALLLPADLFTRGGREAQVQATAREKLAGSLPEPLREAARDLLRRTSVQVPSADVDEEVLEGIRRAVMERRRVCIAYHGRLRSAPRRLEVDPYGLAFRKHAWYLLAHSPRHGEVRKFRLSRIRGVEATALRFSVPEDFSVDACFEGALYVFGGQPQEVRLRFSPRVARFVRERRPLADEHTQTLSDGSLLFRATVNDLDEVAWWIAQYGGDACVLYPPELRDKVIRLAQSILARYGVGERPAAAGEAARWLYEPRDDTGLGRVGEGDAAPEG